MEEGWILTEAGRILDPIGNYSVGYYNGRYMSLYRCQSPQNIQWQSEHNANHEI